MVNFSWWQVLPLTKILTFNIICSLLFGLEHGAWRDRFLDNFNEIIRGMWSVPVNLPFTRYNRSLRASARVQNLVKDLIQEKRMKLEQNEAPPHQDLITCLLSIRDENNKEVLTGDCTKRLACYGCRSWHFIDSNHFPDSASREWSYCLRIRSSRHVHRHKVILFSSLIYAIYLMIWTFCKAIVQKWTPADFQTHPRFWFGFVEQEEIAIGKTNGEPLKWEDLVKMKQTWRVAMETLRMDPPVFGGFHEALKDIEYGGYLVPKGWQVSQTP